MARDPDAAAMPDLPDAWATPSPAHPPPLARGQVIDLPQSRVLSKLTYDADERVLSVDFRNGSVYRYFGVLPEEFEQLAVAPSPGARFNQHIAPYHENERIA